MDEYHDFNLRGYLAPPGYPERGMAAGPRVAKETARQAWAHFIAVTVKAPALCSDSFNTFLTQPFLI